VDFSLSAEQRELTDAATAFARRELNQDLAKREEAGEFPREAWRACADFGILGLPVPAELGGAGCDVLTTALVMEALGYGCHDNGLLFSLNAQLWSIELPLMNFGTPAQQRAYLPGLVSGDIIGGHAMTEPGSGSDALRMRTRAEQRGDHYLLNGDQAVHHQRPGGRSPADLRLSSGPPRARRPLRLPRRRRDARPRGKQQLREDGPADLADGRDSAD
jgi:alkylation response protein AidB-like acyl-CoA dehydrogenase